MIFVPPEGPRHAKIAIVGEAPGMEETNLRRPFAGASGHLLDELLAEAGLDRKACFVTNVFKFRPESNDITSVFSRHKKEIRGQSVPYRDRWATLEFVQHADQTIAELREVGPNVVLALGDTATYVLTGKDGVGKWRGSELESDAIPGLKVIPTYHPAAINRMWAWRWIALADLRRLARESLTKEIARPQFNFITRPSIADVNLCFDLLETKLACGSQSLSVDIETRHGKIACLGVAWTKLDAICIPFLAIGQYGGYWTPGDLLHIVKRLRVLLLHPNAQIVGQNFIYDVQYISRWMGFAPIPYLDTMVGFHTCFLRSPKALDFIASLTNEHYVYWKDDGKLWDPKKTDEGQLWWYNCEDCVRTLEAAEAIEKIRNSFQLAEPMAFQMRLFGPVLRMMLRGIRFDTSRRAAIQEELKEGILARQEKVNFLAGRPINVESPKQLQTYFYLGLGLQPVKSRKSGMPTTDEDALKLLAKREPLVKRLAYSIIELRQLQNSLGVTETTLDVDGRMRCSYNVAGTATTRFASRENAFGSGTNLQNWTKGVSARDSDTGLALPNLRTLLAPDPGKVIVEADLKRADLQIVVWEADDEDLKKAIRDEIDIHSLNALSLFSLSCEVEDVKRKYPKQRQIAKVWVHGTDYGGSPRTMAAHAGITVAESERLQKRWFQLHPGISEWHRRVREEIRATGSVSNRFGYRCFFFDRSEGILPEALAWVPQSTVARVINESLCILDERFSHLAELLLQTHDSLTFQIPAQEYLSTLRFIAPHLLVTIPYPDPLVIELDYAVSDKSWGEVKEVDLGSELRT